MARYLGDKLIAIDNSYHPDIFSVKWSDHIINDIQWLRADTFSWQSGDVYVTAYNKLIEEWNNTDITISYYAWTDNNETVYTKKLVEPIKAFDEKGMSLGPITSSSLDSIYLKAYGEYYRDSSKDIIDAETEDGITFVRSTNGFKIALPDQEQAILNKYNTDGIAWYYILDTENQRFKLPRTKFGFEGLRTNVGNDIAESLPNIKGGFTLHGGESASILSSSYDCFLGEEGSTTQYRTPNDLSKKSGAASYGRVSIDASRSSSTFQDGAPVQERSTQMYLYFYVGEYAREAIEQTAGLNSEMFNGKADVNYVNEQLNNKANINYVNEQLNNKLNIPTRYVVATSNKSLLPSWWVEYSDGWCEQGGYISGNGEGSVSFLKNYTNTKYSLVGGVISSSANSATWRGSGVGYNLRIDGFTSHLATTFTKYWQASGYIR